jgi:hypothetical protein
MPIITLEATNTHKVISKKERIAPCFLYPFVIRICLKVPIDTSVIFATNMMASSHKGTAVKIFVKLFIISEKIIVKK